MKKKGDTCQHYLKWRVRGLTAGDFLKHGIRGQVTIFIIIAVVIVALVGLFFIFQGKEIKDKLNIGTSNSNVDEINSFVEECLKDVSNQVIYNVGQGGGYYFFSEPSTDTGITYYIIDEKNYMPSKNQIEKEISKYVKRNLDLCLGDFSSFQNYDITKGKINVTSKIELNKVYISVKYPLIITKGESVLRIKDFEIEVPVRMGLIYKTITDYIDQEKLEEGMCFSCSVDILESEDLYFDSYDLDNETIVFVLKDGHSKINNKPFEWVFANKY